jgi:hypothetical protein
MIAAVIERCAGIDVGKKFITVCVMTGPADGEARSETRSFGTTVAEWEQFPNEKHLGSSIGLCPGNQRSAGQDKSSHTNKGNKWLRAALTESAWGVFAHEGGPLA